MAIIRPISKELYNRLHPSTTVSGTGVHPYIETFIYDGSGVQSYRLTGNPAQLLDVQVNTASLADNEYTYDAEQAEVAIIPDLSDGDVITVGYDYVLDCFDGVQCPHCAYIDGDGMPLDDNYIYWQPSDYGKNLGIMSEGYSDANRELNDFKLTVEHTTTPGNSYNLNRQTFSIEFYGACCESYDVEVTRTIDRTSYTETLHYIVDDIGVGRSDLTFYNAELTVSSDVTVVFKNFKTRAASQRIKIANFTCGATRYLSDTSDISYIEQIDVLSQDLPLDQLSFTGITGVPEMSFTRSPGCTATVSFSFVKAMNGISGTYTFTRDSGKWYLYGAEIEPTDYSITVTSASDGDNITVTVVNPAPLSLDDMAAICSNGVYYGTFTIVDVERVATDIFSLTGYNGLWSAQNTTYYWSKDNVWLCEPEEIEEAPGEYIAAESATDTNLLERVEDETEIRLFYDMSKHTGWTAYAAEPLPESPDFKKLIYQVPLYGYLGIVTYRQALANYCQAYGAYLNAARQNNRAEIIFPWVLQPVKHTYLRDDVLLLGTAKATQRKRPKTYTFNRFVDYTITSTTPYSVDITVVGANGTAPIATLNDVPVTLFSGFKPTITIITPSESGISIPDGVYNFGHNAVQYVVDTGSRIAFTIGNLMHFDFACSEAKITNPDGASDSEYKQQSRLVATDTSYTYGNAKSLESVILQDINSKNTVTAKIRLRGEKVGDTISVETEWDGVITGIITSMDISFGYEDVADIIIKEWGAAND